MIDDFGNKLKKLWVVCHLRQLFVHSLLPQVLLRPGRLPRLVPCETEIVQNPWLTWAVRVHQRRNLGVRVDRDELGSELLILHDIDGVSIVLVPHFFQCDTHLRPTTTKYK